MGYYFPNVDPTFVYQRESNSYVFRHETAIVNNGTVVLMEIPDFTNKVIAKKIDGTILTEVTTDVLTTNQYRVDYSTGIVYYDISLEGTKITNDYYGTGYVSFPASRVWVDSNTDAQNKSIQQLVNDLDNNYKTTWLAPVNTYADIATTYPTPQVGDTVQTTSDSRIYRYDGNVWTNTQQYNDTAITNFQNRLDGMTKIPNDQEWVSTANQDTFTITNGNISDVKWLTVYVGGVLQPDATLINSTTFQLPEKLAANIDVYAKWIETPVPFTIGHHTTHEAGGQDELDVIKLKNFNEQIATPIQSNSNNIGSLSSLQTTTKSSLVGAINENLGKINTNITNIGTLTTLQTTSKSSLVGAINENKGNISTNSSNIGSLSSLTTTAKSTLVAAVNEVKSQAGTNATSIGTLSSLTTTTKTSVVSAVNEHVGRTDNPHGTTAAQVGALTQTQGDARYVLQQTITWNALTLQNGWVYYGSGATAAYRKDGMNNVFVKGLIKSGTASNGTIMFNLPSGYRPKEVRYFYGFDASGVAQRLEVDPTGDVKIASGSGSINNAFLTLDAIVFTAEQ